MVGPLLENISHFVISVISILLDYMLKTVHLDVSSDECLASCNKPKLYILRNQIRIGKASLLLYNFFNECFRNVYKYFIFKQTKKLMRNFTDGLLN